jgi:hypothetical protein
MHATQSNEAPPAAHFNMAISSEDRRILEGVAKALGFATLAPAVRFLVRERARQLGLQLDGGAQ